MDTASYVVLSRQLGLFNQLDVVANNIANANTDGYKAESVLFKEFLASSGRDAKTSFTNDVSTVRNLEQGALTATGRPLDAAIEGEGYYAIQTPAGIRYTRSGVFHINPQGQLSTKDGYPVLDKTTPITFSQGDIDIKIDEEGTISVLPLGSALRSQVATLTVYKFQNQYAMKKLGNNLYTSTEMPLPATANDDYRIIQSMVESSNVNSTNELTTMIKLNRSVGSTAKFINDVHDLQRKAISTISKMQ